MNSTAPLVKIEMIKRSVRCFIFGLLSLTPALGIPLAVWAIRENRRVKQISGGQWNPAHRYLYWGTFCAQMAVVLLLLEATTAVAIISMPGHWQKNDDRSDYTHGD